MEFVTKQNGVKVVINPCSFIEAFRLKSAIEKALFSNGIKIEEALEKDASLILMSMDSSEDVLEKIFICLRKSTYDNKKIVYELFDDEEARSDLYEVMYNCLKVNVYPFFKPLLSQFGIQLKIPEFGESQK